MTMNTNTNVNIAANRAPTMGTAIKNGDKRAAARLISMIENEDEQAGRLLAECCALKSQSSLKARIIGITGPPGAGKSTLTDQLAKHLLKQHKRVGIIAVDPSSPISGGAFLGDRIRMSDLNVEPDIFIRSMATRGALGGISKAVSGAIRVLEVFGMDTIFVETVGVGQSEVDIAAVADIVVLVTLPGTGDDIQAEKAGVIEIADLIVVNKADHADTDRTIQYLKAMLSYNGKRMSEFPDIEVLSTIASQGKGIAELMEAINRRYEHVK